MDSNMTMTASDMMSMSSMSMTFFTSTTTPIFSSMWMPATQGQYAGTCIFIIMLGLVFRGLLALKARKEAAWLDAEFNRRYIKVAGKQTQGEKIAADSDSKKLILTENGVEEDVIVVKKRGTDVRPWRITTDPVRAVLDTVIAGVGYLLYVSHYMCTRTFC
jgi:hypothetical protein